MCSDQADCCKIHAPTSEVGEANGQGSCAGVRDGVPVDGATLTSRMLEELREDQMCYVIE